jgi:hypothetical protein
MGFTVVFARLKEATPEMLTIVPTSAAPLAT